MFSLVCALSSPTSAKARPSLFGRFTGTTAQSDPSGTYLSAVRLSAFSDRSRSDRDTPEVSRFSCMLFLDVLRFSEYAGPDAHSRSNASARVAFPSRVRGRHPEKEFSKLNSPARRCLCLRFERRLATPSARLEVKVVRYLLPCRTLSFLTTCRFIPALTRFRDINRRVVLASTFCSFVRRWRRYTCPNRRLYGPLEAGIGLNGGIGGLRAPLTWRMLASDTAPAGGCVVNGRLAHAWVRSRHV